MKNVLVGFYRVSGVGLDSVETPLIGNPSEEYARLNAAIRARHPTVKEEIHRIGAVVESRDAAEFVEYAAGSTLAQLFPASPSQPQLRKVGRTFFSGAPFDVVLAHHQAGGVLTINLRGVLRQDGDIRLSGEISANRLAAELPALIDSALGAEGRGTKLNLREAKS